MKKKPVLYYLSGTILLMVSVIVGVIFLWLPSLVEDTNGVFGWISLFVVIFSILLFIFSIYLLKKGNFIKLNKNILKSENELKEEAFKIKLEEDKKRQLLKENEDKMMNKNNEKI